MELSREYLQTFVCPRFLTEEHYRRGHLNILATAPGTQVIGMHTPEMKMLAKAVVKDGSWFQLLSGYAAHSPLTGVSGLLHEERMIWGLVLDYVKCPLDERLALIDAFLPAIDNWAICDNFCCNSKWAAKADKEQLWLYLDGLFHSGEQWHVRVAAILSMCHFLEEDSIKRTFEEIDSLGLQEDEPYYVRMGIAWLLATALAKNQEATLAFVRHCHLPKDIIKLYVRKARESRITKEVKAL